MSNNPAPSGNQQNSPRTTHVQMQVMEMNVRVTDVPPPDFQLSSPVNQSATNSSTHSSPRSLVSTNLQAQSTPLSSPTGQVAANVGTPPTTPQSTPGGQVGVNFQTTTQTQRSSRVGANFLPLQSTPTKEFEANFQLFSFRETSESP